MGEMGKRGRVDSIDRRSMLTIEAIALLQDNYAWLIVSPEGREAAVVDPSESAPIIKLCRRRNITLATILVTHHHWDHTGGIEGLLEEYPTAEVVGSVYELDAKRIHGQTRAVGDLATMDIFGSETKILSVPGHTLGAIAFYVAQCQALFTGDTLFTAGCGRLFEGSHEQMAESLNRLACLPASTQVYCGHEYTTKNLQFCQDVMPDDQAISKRLEQCLKRRRDGQPTVPATMQLEKETNLFLRTEDATLQTILGTDNPMDTFKALRERRNHF
jgi:hydroxyacylglutathione hydrolase